MQRSSQPPQTTKIETELTLKEDMAISEAAAMAGITRDQLAQQALKLLLRDIKTGAVEKESLA